MTAAEQVALNEFLARLREGQITSEQSAQLNALLREHASARQQYLEQHYLCAALHWLHGDDAELTNNGASPSPPATPFDALSAEPGLSPVLGFLGRTTAVLSRPVFWSILLVGVLFTGYVFVISWNMLGKQLASSDDSPRHPVATITASEDAVWSQDSKIKPVNPRPQPGAKWSNPKSEITQGEPLQLTSGLIELQLKQGTTLLIEGPADWKITGENSATLAHGKLVARVPQQAIGFTLETPAATIVDLGTEFGVEIGSSGLAEVHVLNGLVTVQAQNKSNAVSSPVRLEAGKSLQIALDGTQTAGNPETGEKLTRLANGRRKSSAINPGYEVLFHYRLGEDDEHAKPGELAAEQTLGTGTLGSTHPLARVGSPKYIAETANANSKLALTIAGGSRGEGYVGTDFPDLPTDNFVLEAWMRTRSAKRQLAVYVGHPAFNGYGLIVMEGKWCRVYGSQSLFVAHEGLQINEWTHLAFLRERGVSQLFVNGRASGAEVRMEPKPPAPTILIGHDDQEETFDGEIDEVRLMRLNTYFRTNMLLWNTPALSEENPQIRSSKTSNPE